MRKQTLAIGTGSLGAIGILAGLLVFGLVLSSSGGDGFAAGLGIVFAFIYVLVGVIAMAEAGALYIFTRNREPWRWSVRLLGLGAATGAIATILLVGSMLPSLASAVAGEPVSDGSSTTEYAFGVGVWLTPVGIASSGLGAGCSVVSELRRSGDSA